MNRHAYILIGNNETGKTSIQRNLVQLMWGLDYERLPSNMRASITHPDAPRRMIDLSVTNRSYQEKLGLYGNVETFFASHFQEASVAILSSHVTGAEAVIADLILHLKSRFYRVTGVFLSNTIGPEVSHSAMSGDWDDRLLLNNPPARGQNLIESSLIRAAEEFAGHIIRRFTHS